MKSTLTSFALKIAKTLLGMSIMSALCAIVIIALTPEGAWYPLGAALALLVCSNVYGTAWRVGEKDRNMVKFGHIPYEPHKGFIAGALGMAPYLLLSLGLLIWLGWKGAFLFALAFPLSSPLAGIAYLNGHKLFSLTDRVIYRGKPRKRVFVRKK